MGEQMVDEHATVYRVWVADDDPATRDFLATALRRGHYAVEVFADGLELMRAVGHQPDPNAIITDIHMPGKEGVEVIFFLRRHLPNVPIIAISGGSVYGQNFLRLAQQCGANQTLSKPFGADLALAAVASVLNLSESANVGG